MQRFPRYLPLIVAFLTAPLHAGDSPSDSYETAVRARNSGRLDEAVFWFERAVAGAPAERSYRTALADALFAAGKYERLIDTLKPKPTDDDTGAAPEPDANGLRLLARAYAQLDRMPDAKQCWSDLMAMPASTAADRVELARLLYIQGECGQAVEPLNDAAARGLDDATIHLLATQVFMCRKIYLGDVEVRDLADGRPGQLLPDGYVLDSAIEGGYRVAPRDSAVYHAQAARQRDSKSLAIQLLAAQVWLAAKVYPAAVDEYAELEARIGSNWAAPAKAAFFAEFAEALFGVDDVQGYVTRLRQAFELEPARYGEALAAGYRRAAERYNQRGELANFVQCLEWAVAESPKDANLRYRLGNGYWEAGRLRDAAREYQLTLQLVPDHRDRDRMLQAIERAARK